MVHSEDRIIELYTLTNKKAARGSFFICLQRKLVHQFV